MYFTWHTIHVHTLTSDGLTSLPLSLADQPSERRVSSRRPFSLLFSLCLFICLRTRSGRFHALCVCVVRGRIREKKVGAAYPPQRISAWLKGRRNTACNRKLKEWEEKRVHKEKRRRSVQSIDIAYSYPSFFFLESPPPSFFVRLCCPTFSAACVVPAD